AFRAGQIDVAFPGDSRGFAATSGAKIISVPATRQGMFTMNTKAAPWNDVHVRRAVAYALNRDDIIEAAGGGAVPDYTIIPPSQLMTLASKAQVAKLVNSLPTYRFDLAKAKAELAKSAYPNGFSARLDTLGFGAFIPTAQVI